MPIQDFYRQATPDEINFYERQFYPFQDKVLDVASVYADQIYLTGGTALTRLHFHHRLSEDLDFFTLGDDLPHIGRDFAARLEGRGFTLQVDRLDIYFVRFYILEQGFQLKIELAREYHLVEPLVKTKLGVFSNTLNDIGANKITAFEDRAEIKDIIDLYYLTREIPLSRLFALADRKRIPVAYENLLTINALGISGRALITRPLPADTLAEFIETLKDQTEAEIKKKARVLEDDVELLIQRLLWDFPHEDRNINSFSIPVLKRRMRGLPLPTRGALADALNEPE